MSQITYTELKAKQAKTFNDFPCIFAFNNKQLEEGLEKLGAKIEDVYSGQAGMVYKKNDSKKLIDMMETFDKEMEQNLKNDDFLFSAALYEIGNHEYIYTYDLGEALAPLGLSEKTLTEEQRVIVLKAVNEYMRTAES